MFKKIYFINYRENIKNVFMEAYVNIYFSDAALTTLLFPVLQLCRSGGSFRTVIKNIARKNATVLH